MWDSDSDSNSIVIQYPRVVLIQSYPILSVILIQRDLVLWVIRIQVVIRIMIQFQKMVLIKSYLIPIQSDFIPGVIFIHAVAFFLFITFFFFPLMSLFSILRSSLSWLTLSQFPWLRKEG